MNIAEIFHSLQGEGRFAGVPSVFVRVAGCSVQCTWCDTKYAWDESAGEDMSIEQIVEKVGQFTSKFVVLTGGEPMVNPHVGMLLTKLAHSGKHITVETSGIAFMPDLPVDLMSISPKLGRTGTESWLRHIRQLVKHYDYQLKFVIDGPDDIDEVNAAIDSLKGVDRLKVMLMPQAVNREEFLAKGPMVAQLCSQFGFTFCPRLQLLLWDMQKGK
jgi:7-carboxy-7-deazaguanine synthase